MNVEPISLVGRVVRLEPLSEDHAQGLYNAAELSYFKHMFAPVEWSVAGFRDDIKRRIDNPNMLPFATYHIEHDKVIGMTCYMDINRPHKTLEIGSTWLNADYRGTAVNPECKYLLLRHAFENLGANRVQLKTDSRNIISQGAIEKLGAVKEGILRRQFIMQDGHLRDTVIYSIITPEWEAVKAKLEARLGYVLS